MPVVQTCFSTNSDMGSGRKTNLPLTPQSLRKFETIKKDNIPKWMSSRKLKLLSPEERNATGLSDQAVSLLTKVSKKQTVGAAFVEKKSGAKSRGHLGTSTAEECVGTGRIKSHLLPWNHYWTKMKDGDSSTPAMHLWFKSDDKSDKSK